MIMMMRECHFSQYFVHVLELELANAELQRVQRCAPQSSTKNTAKLRTLTQSTPW